MLNPGPVDEVGSRMLRWTIIKVSIWITLWLSRVRGIKPSPYLLGMGCAVGVGWPGATWWPGTPGACLPCSIVLQWRQAQQKHGMLHSVNMRPRDKKAIIDTTMTLRSLAGLCGGAQRQYSGAVRYGAGRGGAGRGLLENFVALCVATGVRESRGGPRRWRPADSLLAFLEGGARFRPLAFPTLLAANGNSVRLRLEAVQFREAALARNSFAGGKLLCGHRHLAFGLDAVTIASR